MPSPFSILHRGITEISGANSWYSKKGKRWKKGVDKSGAVWYSNKAVWQRCSGCEPQKDLWKKIKKWLTNEEAAVIIAMFRRKRRAPCKLNNVTKRKHQTDASFVRDHGRRSKEAEGPGWVNYRSRRQKMKLWKIALWKISSSYGSCWYHFIESLILAQDERWRRA